MSPGAEVDIQLRGQDGDGEASRAGAPVTSPPQPIVLIRIHQVEPVKREMRGV